MPFSFLQRENLSDHAKQLRLERYVPEIQIEGLATGVDNVRTDVFLSPRFVDITRQHISRLLAKYGTVEDFLAEDPFARSQAAPAAGRPGGGFVGAPAVAVSLPGRSGVAQQPKPVEPADFKKALMELHTGSVNRAKAENNISYDLVARLASVKFIRSEMSLQYAQLVERCRTRLKSYEGPRNMMQQKATEMRDRFSSFQINKKTILRRAGQDIFSTLREVEKETLAKLRRSLFGEQSAAYYDMLLNRLLFTADGRDDYVNAEQYVMLGNYERDADRFQVIQELSVDFLKSLRMSGIAADDDRAYDAMLSVADNVQELFAGGTPDEANPKGKSQRVLLNAWVSALESAGIFDQVIASYEAVPLLAQYSPPINPQQLKNALISKTERKRVESLLEEHGKISPDNLHNAVKKVEKAGSAERAKIAARYFGDFLRYHRDLRRFETVMLAMDGVNVIGVSNEKLRELSAINNTLHEFLLPEEQKPQEANVNGHVILKADIRDSTTLTRTLYERGLNPASYFSLNFFDPVNKLLPKYEATKVFIEGDALILALFEHDGERGYGVGKTCVLAKEMIQIVRAYNEQSSKAGLPTLELGLGVCFQESAPMYLMDGSHRIMISKALNLSDRLSGCSKGARKYLGDGTDSMFNVYSFQTVEDADTGGMPDEFLVRYNIGGIHINDLAFNKLGTEISLKLHEVELPMIWDKEKVRLFSGMVPVGQGIFHPIVVREGLIAHVDARDFRLKHWTDKKYYEVCVNETIYEFLASEFKTA